MPGPRETDSDMGISSKPTLGRAWAEIRRLSKCKAELAYTEGEFKMQGVKREYLEKEVQAVREDVEAMQKGLTPLANKASEAKRLASEAKKEVKSHPCIHEHTLQDLQTNVGATAAMIKDFTKSRKRKTLGQWLAFAGFVIAVGGSIIAWRTDAEVGKRERIELKDNDKKQDAALERIESKLDRPDERGLKDAFKQALRELEKEQRFR